MMKLWGLASYINVVRDQIELFICYLVASPYITARYGAIDQCASKPAAGLFSLSLNPPVTIRYSITILDIGWCESHCIFWRRVDILRNGVGEAFCGGVHNLDINIREFSLGCRSGSILIRVKTRRGGDKHSSLFITWDDVSQQVEPCCHWASIYRHFPFHFRVDW